MPILQIVAAIVSALFAIAVCIQVSRGRLLLRYSLIWLIAAVITALAAIFPLPIFALSSALGFTIPLNFILFVAVFFLLVICLSLSVIVSRQQIKIKNLAQRIALLDGKADQGNEFARSSIDVNEASFDDA